MAYVNYREGSSSAYAATTPDEHTFYKVDNTDVYLGDILLSGGDGNILYGTSSTSYSTATKAVTCTDAKELCAGLAILINFSNYSTANTPCLNVNSLGAKNIYVNGSTASSSNYFRWGNSANILFVYNGTYWCPIGTNNSYYGTSSTAAATAAKTSSINNFVLQEGTSVTICFTYANTNSSPTLNISSTGARSIKGYTDWSAGDYVTFVFGDTYWNATKTESSIDSDEYALKKYYGDTQINVGRLSGSTEGEYSVAEGYKNTAAGNGSHAEGGFCITTGLYDHAEGYYTEITSTVGGNHVEGGFTVVSGESGCYAHAEGMYGEASNWGAHAEGGYDSEASDVKGSTASGYGAHAEGISTMAVTAGGHAEGYNCITSGDTNTIASTGRHAEGYGTTASGNYSSHAEGYQTTASGTYGSHAEGRSTTASGAYGSHAEGYGTTASGSGSHAEGYYTTASGNYSHAQGYETTAKAYNNAMGHYNNDTTNGSYTGTSGSYALTLGNGTSSSASNAFRITYGGTVYALSAFNSSGADYAEFVKEWADGNPDEEDRVGYFVTVKDDKLVKANDGDYIIGITSGCPSVVGNADEDYYYKYQRDDFGRVIFIDIEEEEEEEILVPDEEQINIDKQQEQDESNVNEEIQNLSSIEDDSPFSLPKPLSFTEYCQKYGGEEKAVTYHTETVKTSNIIENGAMALAADYDPSLQSEYIERKDRPEWDYVGMVGTLHVRDDGTCQVGGLCKCGIDGIATAATEMGFFTYFVIERVTDNIIKVIK